MRCLALFGPELGPARGLLHLEAQAQRLALLEVRAWFSGRLRFGILFLYLFELFLRPLLEALLDGRAPLHDLLEDVWLLIGLVRQSGEDVALVSGWLRGLFLAFFFVPDVLDGVENLFTEVEAVYEGHFALPDARVDRGAVDGGDAVELELPEEDAVLESAPADLGVDAVGDLDLVVGELLEVLEDLLEVALVAVRRVRAGQPSLRADLQDAHFLGELLQLLVHVFVDEDVELAHLRLDELLVRAEALVS